MTDESPGEASRTQLRTFPELDPTRWMHPLDVAATRTLKRVPGFEFVTKKVME